jgi:hypothetical protein
LGVAAIAAVGIKVIVKTRAKNFLFINLPHLAF